ncbi:hypothetical protein BDR22DRAFT_972808 [Usnea florida]
MQAMSRSIYVTDFLCHAKTPRHRPSAQSRLAPSTAYAALDFAAYYWQEIDIVTLREACLDDRFLAEVFQSWTNKAQSGAFMDSCAIEHGTPVVGSSLGVFLGSQFEALKVASLAMVCASALAIAALYQVCPLAATVKRFLANCYWRTRCRAAGELIEDGTDSASQPMPRNSDASKQGTRTSVCRQKKRKGPPSEAEDGEALPSRAPNRPRRSRSYSIIDAVEKMDLMRNTDLTADDEEGLPLRAPKRLRRSRSSSSIDSLAYQLQVEWCRIYLDLDTVATAFQIDEFTKTGHSYLDLLKPVTEHCVQYITTRLPRPNLQQPIATVETSRGQRARSRSVDPDPQTYWPSDWSIDKTAFRQALKQFHKATWQLRELIWQPPLVGEIPIPEDTSRSTTPPGDSRNTTPPPVDSPDSNSLMGTNNSLHKAKISISRIRFLVRMACMRLLRDDLRDTIQQQQPATQQPAHQLTQQTQQPVVQQVVETKPKLRVEGLGFFDPGFESEHNESIVNSGRHIYYRDMFTWIDHLKDLVKEHGEATVRPLITHEVARRASASFSASAS